jgi:hypothetical protein
MMTSVALRWSSGLKLAHHDITSFGPRGCRQHRAGYVPGAVSARSDSCAASGFFAQHAIDRSSVWAAGSRKALCRCEATWVSSLECATTAASVHDVRHVERLRSRVARQHVLCLREEQKAVLRCSARGPGRTHMPLSSPAHASGDAGCRRLADSFRDRDSSGRLDVRHSA